MSYMLTPIYRCGVCGREETGESAVPWPTSKGYLMCLPDGWTGGRGRWDQCFCAECSTAIARIKVERGRS